MKKKLLAILISCMLVLSCVGCGTTYQEVTDKSSTSDSFAEGVFTVISEWGGGISSGKYKIVYANDTKVKYFLFYEGDAGGISPLYNADGTLQIYDGE